jgi:hypothetical protein
MRRSGLEKQVGSKTGARQIAFRLPRMAEERAQILPPGFLLVWVKKVSLPCSGVDRLLFPPPLAERTVAIIVWRINYCVTDDC